MFLRLPISTLTDTHCPDTTLFRSNRFSWGDSAGWNLVEVDALVGAMILRQAEDALGDGVEQRLVGPTGDAARRGVDPARRPILLLRGVLVEMEAACALQVDGQFGQLLARAYRDELVERPFRTRGHVGLPPQSRPDIDRIESGAHRIIARDLLTDAALLDPPAAVPPHARK